MDFPGLLVSIIHANPEPGRGHGMMYVIIRHAHAYLEETLRRALEGQENVNIIVGRRHGERRTAKEQLVEVVVTEESSGRSERTK